MMYEEDSALLRRVVVGADGAWETLILTHQTTLKFAIVRTLKRFHQTPDEDLVADMMGDLLVFLAEDGFRRLRTYGAKASLRQWLKVVAGNFVVDRLRRRKRWESVRVLDDRVDGVDPSPGPEERFVEDERRRAVAALFDALSDEDRLFVELYYARGRSFQEVADLMGTTLGAIYARKNRLRKRLRALAEAASLTG